MNRSFKSEGRGTGIGLGFNAHVVVEGSARKSEDIHPLMWIASAASLIAFLQVPISKLFAK